jgi:hypothetical protein
MLSCPIAQPGHNIRLVKGRPKFHAISEKCKRNIRVSHKSVVGGVVEPSAFVVEDLREVPGE